VSEVYWRAPVSDLRKVAVQFFSTAPVIRVWHLSDVAFTGRVELSHSSPDQ
jgi:hypothetical protein